MSADDFDIDRVEIPRLKLLTYSTVNKLQTFILKNNLIPLLILGSLLGVGLSAYLGYQYYQTNQFLRVISTKQVLNKEEMKGLVEEIGKIVKLPPREDPSVATVTDVNRLKDQPFFAESKNGDRVLVYVNSQKVILYDPMSKKVVNMSPLGALTTTGSPQQAASSNTPVSASSQAKIILRNGTSVTGLASKIETEIKQAFPQANIVNKDNTLKDSYEKTMVVVLTKAAQDAGSNLAKLLNGAISELPAGEIKPSGADLLIILGKDKI